MSVMESIAPTTILPGLVDGHTIKQCNDCGAFAHDDQPIKHHPTCRVASVDLSAKVQPFIRGTFTVQGKTRHVTVKFYQPTWLKERIANKEWPAGTMVAGYLYGPDNSSDFKGVAFVFTDGRVHWWKAARARQQELHAQMWSINYVLTHKELLGELGYEYALRSGRCCRCGRKLTVPASIAQGMGPECAEKGFV